MYMCAYVIYVHNICGYVHICACVCVCICVVHEFSDTGF